MTPPPSSPPCPTPAFDLRLQGSAQVVRPTLSEVVARLAARGVDTASIATVQLVLAEALNNIIEHALPGQPDACRITVRGTLGPDAVELVLTDAGLAMPGHRLPAGTMPKVDVPTAQLPEGGFGWSMIRELAEQVSYERIAGQNRLYLRIPLAV
ncbi:ATP-binding protein [Sulfitobacter sp. HNIBRBA3233]|uniref:ATP-binding protein n=1 Tax=Sulfitobacter marinivivus TaxID=3158558 RepID=UPI0032DF0D38